MLTVDEGFAAMYVFLDMYWQEFATANLGDVLSEIQPGMDAPSADAAAWEDWKKAVQAVLARRPDSSAP